MPKVFGFFLLLLFFGVGGCSRVYDESDVDLNDQFSDVNQEIVKSKRKKILKEIAELKDHPWAGEYYLGNGVEFGERLILAPENGFTMTLYDNAHLWVLDFGMAVWDEDRVKLSPVFGPEPEASGLRYYPSEYYLIDWGQRIYLIRTDEIILFCNAINQGTEPRDEYGGDFFIRVDLEKAEMKGKPVIPEEFRAYLLDEPFDAEIIAVSDIREEKRNKFATVVVNKGKKDGLLPGMELLVMDQDEYKEKVELSKVEETQSEGTLCFERSWLSEKNPPPEVGWRLSTCPKEKRSPSPGGPAEQDADRDPSTVEK